MTFNILLATSGTGSLNASTPTLQGLLVENVGGPAELQKYMLEYWTVTTVPSMKARVVAISAGARGCPAAWTTPKLGMTRKAIGASRSDAAIRTEVVLLRKAIFEQTAASFVYWTWPKSRPNFSQILP